MAELDMGHITFHAFPEDEGDGGGESSFNLLDRDQYTGLSKLHLFTSTNRYLHMRTALSFRKNYEKGFGKRTLPVAADIAGRSV